MTIHLEFYQLVILGCSIVAGFYALAKVIGKMVASKFEEISEHLNKQDGNIKRLEAQLSELRVEIARDYVRRDDYIRDIGTLSTKFEALAINLERMLHDMTKETIQMIKEATRK